MVVGQHGALGTVRGVEVAAGGAEVVGSSERGVEDVLGIECGVAVAVAAPGRPGRGDELHRTDGAVPAGVAVVAAMVGVGDRGVAVRPVEHRSEDGGPGLTVRPQRAAAVTPVVGLDAPDPRNQGPGNVAGRGGAVRRRGCLLVGGGGDGRNVGHRSADHDRRRRHTGAGCPQFGEGAAQRGILGQLPVDVRAVGVGAAAGHGADRRHQSTVDRGLR